MTKKKKIIYWASALTLAASAISGPFIYKAIKNNINHNNNENDKKEREANRTDLSMLKGDIGLIPGKMTPKRMLKALNKANGFIQTDLNENGFRTESIPDESKLITEYDVDFQVRKYTKIDWSNGERKFINPSEEWIPLVQHNLPDEKDEYIGGEDSWIAFLKIIPKINSDDSHKYKGELELQFTYQQEQRAEYIEQDGSVSSWSLSDTWPDWWWTNEEDRNKVKRHNEGFTPFYSYKYSFGLEGSEEYKRALQEEKALTKVTKIGWFWNRETDLITALAIPRFVEEVPSQLPKEIESIEDMFRYYIKQDFATSNLKTDISGWDTSNVKSMWKTFEILPIKQDLSKWNVENVIKAEKFGKYFEKEYMPKFKVDSGGWSR